MKTIYLGGPILSRTTEQANEWRDLATKLLKKKFNILNPMRRQFSDKDALGINEIVQMDKEDVKNSDILLVNYNCARKETTLCGTAMEIHLAHTLGKYVIAFTDLPKEKWSPWMIYHCTRICTDFHDAINYIKKHF
jgi:nucleoside 2-deoxyribosyltransferase